MNYMVYRRRFVAFGTKINTIGEQDIQQKYVFSFPNPPPVPFLPSRLFIPPETEKDYYCSACSTLFDEDEIDFETEV